MPTTSAQDLLAAHPFLAGLDEKSLARLATWARRAPFHAGSRVFSEGGRADRFWLIRDGKVRLDAAVPGRGDVEIDLLGPDTALGWSWLFAPYRWHFGAVAVEPTLTVELDGAGVRQLCVADPAFGYDLTQRFMRVVVERLQATRARLLTAPETASPIADDT
jgi:CRP/FNR family transcriptional regulator, cyclic AMP receptor protein